MIKDPAKWIELVCGKCYQGTCPKVPDLVEWIKQGKGCPNGDWQYPGSVAAGTPPQRSDGGLPTALAEAYRSPLLAICRGGCGDFAGGVHCRAIEVAAQAGGYGPCGAGSIPRWIAAGRSCPAGKWNIDAALAQD